MLDRDEIHQLYLGKKIIDRSHAMRENQIASFVSTWGEINYYYLRHILEGPRLELRSLAKFLAPRLESSKVGLLLLDQNVSLDLLLPRHCGRL
jgi:hypothetical protein